MSNLSKKLPIIQNQKCLIPIKTPIPKCEGRGLIR